MKLTKEQTKHVETIRWLFSAQRAAGKSFLLACVLIETAVKHKNQRIYPRDISSIMNNSYRSNLELIGKINYIYKNDSSLNENYELEYSLSQGYIKMMPKTDSNLIDIPWRFE